MTKQDRVTLVTEEKIGFILIGIIGLLEICEAVDEFVNDNLTSAVFVSVAAYLVCMIPLHHEG